jgi:hypothetical protein
LFGVFCDDVARPDFADDAEHFAHKAGADAVDSFTLPVDLACLADVLAGKSSTDNVHFSTPLVSVECGNVFMDWEWWQVPVDLSLVED